MLQVLARDAGLKIDLRTLTLGDCARTMLDGGMGSFQITPPSGDVRVGWISVAERWYRDVDGIPVSLTLNLNRTREPVEVDIWKADNTPMVRLPVAVDLLREGPEQ